MATINSFGVPLGSAPEDGHATTVSIVLDFLDNPRQVYEASGNGSARDIRDFQSAFVDNSANFFPLTIECFGTGMKLVVPGNAQAILPVACPIGSFGLILEFPLPTPTSRVPITLFDIPQPYVVWPRTFASGSGGGGGGAGQGTYDPSTGALLVTDKFNLSDTYTQLVNVNTSIFEIYNPTFNRHRSMKIKNIGAETAYIQTDPFKDIEVAFPISPGETLSLEHTPNRPIQAFTTQNSTQVVVLAY